MAVTRGGCKIDAGSVCKTPWLSVVGCAEYIADCVTCLLLDVQMLVMLMSAEYSPVDATGVRALALVHRSSCDRMLRNMIDSRLIESFAGLYTVLHEHDRII